MSDEESHIIIEISRQYILSLMTKHISVEMTLYFIKQVIILNYLLYFDIESSMMYSKVSVN